MTTVLAFETSTEVASVALLHKDQLIARQSNGVQTHSQTVLPMAQALLAEAGIALLDCDAIAFGSGPGSFTGVRTACGIAQGLAFGSGLPVVPVVTLMAMAEASRKATGSLDVLAILDARMDEVYWAHYQFDDEWRELAAPTLSRAVDIGVDGSPFVIGNLIAEQKQAPDIAILPETLRNSSAMYGLPHAAEVAELGRIACERGRVFSAAEAQPLYLRNKVALTTAERQARNRA